MTIGAILWIIAGFILVLFSFDVLTGDVKWIVLAAGLMAIGFPFLGGPVIVRLPAGQPPSQ